MIVFRFKRPPSFRRATLILSGGASRREYSDAGSVGYSSKVYAIPFIDHDLTELKARFTDWHESATTSPFQAFTSLFFRRSVQKVVEITYFQPVYFPTWRVDAAVEAQLWHRDSSKPATCAIQFLNSYFPGSALGSMSKILQSDADEEDESVPLTLSMLTLRGGEKVSPLPYTLSPLALPALVKRMDARDACISDDLEYEPSTVQFHFLAAYPIVMPAYLATIIERGGNEDGTDRESRWCIPGGPSSLTSPMSPIALDATNYEPSGNFASISFLDLGKAIRTDYYDTRGETDDEIEIFEDYIQKLVVKNSFEEGSGTGKIDWNDPRIFPAKGAQVAENRQWLTEVHRGHWSMQRWLRGMRDNAVQMDEARRRNIRTIATIAPDDPKTQTAIAARIQEDEQQVEDVRRQVGEMEEKAKTVAKGKNELKPKWLKEWERKQSKPNQVSGFQVVSKRK